VEHSSTKYLTLGAAASFLGVSRYEFLKMISLYQIDVIETVGGHSRILQSDLEDLKDLLGLGLST
jgi:hypothetical protein